MTAPHWVYGPESLAEADTPLHAGLLKDLSRGNLLRTLSEGRVDLEAYQHDGLYVEHVCSTTYWEHVAEFPALALPLRRGYGAISPRALAVELEGYTSASSAEVRVYLRQWASAVVAVDASDALPGESAYGELDFSGAWAVDDDTITPVVAATARPRLADGSDGDCADYPVVYVAVLVRAAAALTLRLRGLRIVEEVGV